MTIFQSPDWQINNDGNLESPTGKLNLADLAAGAVDTSNLAPGAVDANAIAALAITAGKIAPGAVDADAIAALAITAGKIFPGAVDANALATSAITSGKISPGAVDANALATSSVTSGKIAPGAVDATALATSAVTSGKIATGAVDASALASSAVTTAKIATGAVDTNALATSAVTTAKIATGAVDTNALGASSVTSGKISPGAVDSNALASSSVTTAKIATGAVNSNALGASAVTTFKIYPGAVNSDALAPASVNDTKLVTDIELQKGKFTTTYQSEKHGPTYAVAKGSATATAGTYAPAAYDLPTPASGTFFERITVRATVWLTLADGVADVREVVKMVRVSRLAGGTTQILDETEVHADDEVTLTIALATDTTLQFTVGNNTGSEAGEIYVEAKAESVVVPVAMNSTGGVSSIGTISYEYDLPPDDGTYTAVATGTGGSGTGATLSFTVSGNVVTSAVTIDSAGTGYAVDDWLYVQTSSSSSGQAGVAFQVATIS